MYWGSVRFFKHLIITASILVLSILLILTIVFAFNYKIEREKAVNATKMYNEIASEDKLNIPDDANFDQIYVLLKNRGYTANDIIDVLVKYDDEVISEIYKNHFLPDSTNPMNSYSSLYPDLYVDPPEKFTSTDKTVYLTFDDGPSENTLSVLSILEKYDIKATFFMCGSKNDNDKLIMKKVADSGHSIGIHSLSHKYPAIYESVDSYLEDFNNTYNNIYEATGIKPDIFRFPGGSINNYNRLTYQQLIAETSRRGFVYYDWNVSGEDANVNATWTSIYKRVINGTKNKNRIILLLHDSDYKDTTVLVLEDLILELQKQGFSFDKITNEVMPVTFEYID